jgi:cob(I)alamin adenosyltransferase
MKIYTKKGDSGTTSLIGGSKVSKHHLRIEAYGTVDECNSVVGLLADHLPSDTHLAELREIQDRLFTIGSQLASDRKDPRMKLPKVKPEDVEALEKWIDNMDEVLPAMKSFVLPGGHPANSHAHLARCVCRRAERQVVHLNEHERVAEIIIKYLNRLSDYLFTLARKIAHDEGAAEIPWHPKID